jgi:hypothetical protein
MTRVIARGLAVAAVAWCVAIGGWLWITPIRYKGVASTAYADSSGVMRQETYETAGSRSFSEVSALGPVPLLIPVLLAAMGASSVWRRRMLPAVIATGVLLFFTALAGFSIGAGYVPAAAALAWAIVALGNESTTNRRSDGRRSSRPDERRTIAKVARTTNDSVRRSPLP